MPQTLTNQMLHCIFATGNCRKLITPPLAGRLYSYFDGIARFHNIILLAAGGMADHVHLLISTPPPTSTSEAIGFLKKSSSDWIHQAFPERRDFTWQRGYGVFSIGVSEFGQTVRYIEDQDRHHRRRSFREEYISFASENAVEFDELHMFD